MLGLARLWAPSEPSKSPKLPLPMFLWLGKVRNTTMGVTPKFRCPKGRKLLTLRGIQRKQNPFKWGKNWLQTHTKDGRYSVWSLFSLGCQNTTGSEQAENTVGKCMVCYRYGCQQWTSELVWQQWEQGILGTAHTFFLDVRGHQHSWCWVG